MGCNECGKPKCNGKCGCKSPKVLQINNPAEYITFHKVSIPAAMGDSTTNPPAVGKYKNVLLYYEADQTSWLYSTDGIPTNITGQIGPVGPQGPAGTITIGETTTGSAGSDASVENVGTPENAILNFTIPQGEQGIQGETGPQGYMNEQDVRDVVNTIIPEGFFDDESTVSDCGTSFELDDVFGGNLSVFELKGNSFQQTYTGKNLFNKESDVLEYSGYTGCYLPASLTSTRLNSTSGATTSKTLLVKLQEGQSYTIQKVASARFRFGFTNTATPALGTDGAITSRISSNDTGASKTFTVPSGSPYFVCNFYSNDQSLDVQTGYETILNSIQIALGDEVTPYEPYVGGVPSPNPDYPQPIQTVTGEQTITVNGTDYPVNLGKNLNDNIGWEQGQYASGVWGTGNTKRATSGFIPITGGTYTMSLNATGNLTSFININYFDGDKTWLGDRSTLGMDTFADTDRVKTFTLPNTASYLRVTVRPYGGDSQGDNTIQYAPNEKLQVETGSTNTSFVDYVTPIELCKLGDYQDYIWKDGEDWKIHKETNKITVDGSENWQYPDSGDNYTFFQFSRANFISKYGAAADFYASNSEVGFAKADKFEQIVASAANMRTKQGIGFSTDGDDWLRISVANTIATTVEAFTAWLAENITTLYYALATPIDTAITDPMLITQLEEIRLESGSNTITLTTSGLLGELCIGGFKNNWSGTISEIEGQIGSINNAAGLPSNPIYYGADPTGTTDSAAAINACIQANKGKSISFTPGIYLVNSAINLPYANADKVSINGNGAVLRTTATLDSMIVAGFDRPANYIGNDVGFPFYIDKLVLDGSAGNVTNGILNMKGCKDLKVLNCTIFRFTNGVKVGDATGSSTDILISNCLLYGKGSEYAGVGVISNCNDNNVDMCRIYGFRKGFEIHGYINITKCHVLLRWANQTGTNFNPYTPNSEEFNEYYEQTMFADASGTCRIVTCYCDSMYKYLEVRTTGMITVDSSFYYNARDVNMHLFEIYQAEPKITIANCSFNLRKYDDCQVIVPKTELVLQNVAQINLSNNLISGFANMTNSFDIILSSTSTDFHNQIAGEEGEWQIVKAFTNFADSTSIAGNLYIGSNKYELRLDASSITQWNKSATDSAWDAGVFVKDRILFLCIRHRSGSFAGSKFDFFTEHIFYRGWPVNPVLNNPPATSSRKLSDYMEDVPTTTVTLKVTQS